MNWSTFEEVKVARGRKRELTAEQKANREALMRARARKQANRAARRELTPEEKAEQIAALQIAQQADADRRRAEVERQQQERRDRLRSWRVY